MKLKSFVEEDIYKVKEYDALGYNVIVSQWDGLPFCQVIIEKPKSTYPELLYHNGLIYLKFSSFPELANIAFIEEILNNVSTALEVKKWFEENLDEIFDFESKGQA